LGWSLFCWRSNCRCFIVVFIISGCVSSSSSLPVLLVQLLQPFLIPFAPTPLLHTRSNEEAIAADAAAAAFTAAQEVAAIENSDDCFLPLSISANVRLFLVVDADDDIVDVVVDDVVDDVVVVVVDDDDVDIFVVDDDSNGDPDGNGTADPDGNADSVGDAGAPNCSSSI